MILTSNTNTLLALNLLALLCFLGPSVASSDTIPSFSKEKSLSFVSKFEREAFISEEKVAVVVGLSRYPSFGGLSSLSYADQDANAMAKQLRVLGYKVRVLTNEEATGGAVSNLLQGLGQYLEPNQGTFLFYFSGHGFAKNDNNYLATFETSPQNIEHTGLSLNKIIEEMQGTGAKRLILLVDACRNEPELTTKSVGNNSQGFVDFKLAEGTQILFSTKFGGKSYEYSNLNQGVFTHYLLKGLKGQARQNNGVITFRNLADYVAKSVKDFSYKENKFQVPFIAGEAYGDFLIHANKIVQSEPLIQQDAVDLSLPQLDNSNIDSNNIGGQSAVPNKSSGKRTIWYKNPWFWAGVVAASGGAVYLNQQSNSDNGRETILK